MFLFPISGTHVANRAVFFQSTLDWALMANRINIIEKQKYKKLHHLGPVKALFRCVVFLGWLTYCESAKYFPIPFPAFLAY